MFASCPEACWIRECLFHDRSNAFNVVGIEKGSRISRDLAKRPAWSGTNDRTVLPHCLENRDPETFIKGRIDQGDRLLVSRSQCCILSLLLTNLVRQAEIRNQAGFVCRKRAPSKCNKIEAFSKESGKRESIFRRREKFLYPPRAPLKRRKGFVFDAVLRTDEVESESP